MGRRKNKYQSISEIQSDNAYNRMAGDPLVQEALDYLANNPTSESFVDAAVQDAMEYLPRRRNELRQLGVSEEQVLDLGKMISNVPEPVRIRNQAGNEIKRIHTQYSKNPVTDMHEVIPLYDNNETIVAPYGQRMNNSTAATEAAQMHILRLMGAQPEQYAQRGTDYYSDFKAQLDGKIHQIDGMVRGSDRDNERVTSNIPVFMNVRPAHNGSRTIYNAGEEKLLQNDVRTAVSNQMTSKNQSIVDAVDALMSREVGKLTGPEGARSLGKLLRNDINRVGNRNSQYDSLIVTGYDAEDKVIKRPGVTRQDQMIVKPPKTAHIVDLDVARQVVQKNGSRGRLFASSNSDSHTGRPFEGEAYNAKLQTIIDLAASINGKPVAKDVVKSGEYPYVYQAMRDVDKYIK